MKSWDRRLVREARPKYRLFFMLVTTFGHDKISTQKIKKQFFSKISSILQRLMQITSLLNLVFLLILRPYTYPNVCKASTHQCMYIIQIFSCSLWVLDHSRDRTSSYYCRRKKMSVLPPGSKKSFPKQLWEYAKIDLAQYGLKQEDEKDCKRWCAQIKAKIVNPVLPG